MVVNLLILFITSKVILLFRMVCGLSQNNESYKEQGCYAHRAYKSTIFSLKLNQMYIFILSRFEYTCKHFYSRQVLLEQTVRHNRHIDYCHREILVYPIQIYWLKL